MPKAPNSVVGVDLGQHTLKAVHLQRKNSRPTLTGYASRPTGGLRMDNADTLAHHLKLLFNDLGTVGKACSVAVSSPQALIRIIEQPTTPPNLLRDALRLNGLALLNQDVRDFVLDCDQIPAGPRPHHPAGTADAEVADFANGKPVSRYLVGGLPRAELSQVSTSFAKNRTTASRVQLAPVCNYNAFEFSHPEVFNTEVFVLVDIGHVETRVLVGAKKELMLVRTIDYGGNHFLEAITADGGIDRDSAIMLIEQNDPGMVDAGRQSLLSLVHELRSSIGFVEGQLEETISRVYFSGGLVKAIMPLQILSDELDIACNTWDPFQHCQVDLPKPRLAPFDSERTHLNVACGAALELMMAPTA